MDNTLFIGNGFSMSLFEGIPEWEKLFPGIPQVLAKANATLLYEIYRKMQNSQIGEEDLFKRNFLEKINKPFEGDTIKSQSDEVESFGTMLIKHHVGNIITTNYDGGIEWILTKKCGYEQVTPADLVPEDIYSVRTYKLYRNGVHTVKLWKIHGDGEPNEKNRRIKSVTLGFDQYCGAIAKEYAYVKGEYDPNLKHGEIQTPANKPKCLISLRDKCSGKEDFDGISWIELFFTTNVYFVGFGMRLSEIDIWWLLNQHSRLKEKYPENIKNTITLVDNELHPVEQEVRELLPYFDVRIVSIPGIEKNKAYLSNIFRMMKADM